MQNNILHHIVFVFFFHSSTDLKKKLYVLYDFCEMSGACIWMKFGMHDLCGLLTF